MLPLYEEATIFCIVLQLFSYIKFHTSNIDVTFITINNYYFYCKTPKSEYFQVHLIWFLLQHSFIASLITFMIIIIIDKMFIFIESETRR